MRRRRTITMKNEKKVGSITTFIGVDTGFEGSIAFKGTIRVDGRVTGKISSNGGTVIVGEKAVVNAEIVVGTVVVMGEVNGSIDASDRIEIYPPGRVGGDIHSPTISIEPGGIFNGNCIMKSKTVLSAKNEASPKIQAVPGN
jgi:cytoskeletal protein CcmA (bactofilin family)